MGGRVFLIWRGLARNLRQILEMSQMIKKCEQKGVTMTILSFIGSNILRICTACETLTECPKKMTLCFGLISWQPSIGFSNHFFHLKTEILTQILNTKPFLFDI